MAAAFSHFSASTTWGQLLSLFTHSLVSPRLASMAMCFVSILTSFHASHSTLHKINTLPLLDHQLYQHTLVFTIPHLRGHANITKPILLFDLDHGCTSTIYNKLCFMPEFHCTLLGGC
jgi:hypothetical protein